MWIEQFVRMGVFLYHLLFDLACWYYVIKMKESGIECQVSREKLVWVLRGDRVKMQKLSYHKAISLSLKQSVKEETK